MRLVTRKLKPKISSSEQDSFFKFTLKNKDLREMVRFFMSNSNSVEIPNENIKGIVPSKNETKLLE
ncbi:MAG: hypothetical protein ACFFCS_26470 [Candidatus Hodarchaeota archaeon]